MKKTLIKHVLFENRQGVLLDLQRLKMARSAHAYVRGSTVQFYKWLEALNPHSLPEGPPVWICGDCHAGNLGPVADADGRVDIQIRDVDQTVIGNPSHDLIRLGLSLATAVRGSDLPGVTTAKMIEQMTEGYSLGLVPNEDGSAAKVERPQSIHVAMRQAMKRTWKQLAQERIEDRTPKIPLGKRFWPLSKEEDDAIKTLFETEAVRKLVTLVKSREDNASVRVLDAAYWVKGCSSLGRLRYAVLLGIGTGAGKDEELCLMDVKEAFNAAAPHYDNVAMPSDNAERVVEGARHVAPYLGERILSATLLDRSVFVRELLPQDLKIELGLLTCNEAVDVARYLAMVVGKAHARQMDNATQQTWLSELKRNRSKTLDAPSWLWSSIVDLIGSHEVSYLGHCRKYAMESTMVE
jgi:uncharacterized protein (DUF2252 family)